MSKKTLTALFVCFVVVVVTTIAAYGLLLGTIFDVKIRWISLLWILFSEVACIVKILAIRNQTIFTATTITTSVFHMIASIGCAGIFMVVAPDAINGYIFVNIVLLAALIICDVLLIRVGAHVEAVNHQQGSVQALVNNCCTRAEQISVQAVGTPYFHKIEEIVRLLKYSDTTVMTPDDSKLPEMIAELSALLNAESLDDQKIEETLAAVNLIAQKRAKQAKRGSY